MRKIVVVVVREIREALPSFLFFFAIFELGHITKSLLLEEYHVTAGRTAVAAIGALIVAKAVLIADALPLSNVFAKRPLAYSIVWKALIYGLIAFAFRYLEELIELARKYEGIVAAHQRLLEETSWPHFWVILIWVAFSLLLYCTGVELIRTLGPERVTELLFRSRAPAA
jgi:hypothetical protein